MPTGDNPALGVLAPDSARTVLVINTDGELGVALRDKLDRAYALVKDVRPDEALDGFAASIPWPWMVVGNVPTLPDAVVQSFHGRPMLIFWKGALPAGMPRHARQFTSFSELTTAVGAALGNTVAGMKLAVGLGVDLPNGEYARSAELQALVSNHPLSFDVPLDAFRSASRVLNAHGIPCHAVRDEDGTVSLAQITGAPA